MIGTDGSIIVATNKGVLFALDSDNGTTRWSYDAGAGYGNDLSTSPLVLADGAIVWPGPNGTLYGLAATGRLDWTFDLGGFVLSPALAPSGRIYAAKMTGTVRDRYRRVGCVDRLEDRDRPWFIRQPSGRSGRDHSRDRSARTDRDH